VTKPAQFPYIEMLSKKSRIRGVTITITAKLVIRSAYANG
jgi:hypothetical protein